MYLIYLFFINVKNKIGCHLKKLTFFFIFFTFIVSCSKKKEILQEIKFFKYKNVEYEKIQNLHIFKFNHADTNFYKTGKNYGILLKKIFPTYVHDITKYLETLKILTYLRLSLYWKNKYTIEKRMEYFEKRLPPEYIEEMKGIADGLNAPYSLILHINLIPDTARAYGCSFVGFWGNKTIDKSPIIGRNLDWLSLGVLEKYPAIHVYRNKHKLPFINIGYAGLSNIITGINKNGLFASILDSGITNNIYNPINKSSYVFSLRQILETKTNINQAYQFFKKEKFAFSINLGLSDKKTVKVLEKATHKQYLRSDLDNHTLNYNPFKKYYPGAIITTNHYEKLNEPPSFNFHTQKRFRKIKNFIEKNKKTVNIIDVKKLLMHPILNWKLSIFFTLQIIVYEPRKQILYISVNTKGQKKDFIKINLKKLLK